MNRIIKFINDNADKFLHLSFSALLVVIIFAILTRFTELKPTLIIILSLGLSFLVGATKELHDEYIRNVGDWYDMLYNVYGLILGFLIIKLL